MWSGRPRPLLLTFCGSSESGFPKSLLIQPSDLPNQRADFLRRKLAGVLRHATLAVGDDLAQFAIGCRFGFIGYQRWSAKMSPLGSLSVTLGAVRLEDRVFQQVIS
jgi:hypothetical protein